MSKLFKKLGYRQQKRILILNAPMRFEEYMMEMLNTTIIDRIPLPDYDYDFILAFVHREHQAASYVEYMKRSEALHTVFLLGIETDKESGFLRELNNCACAMGTGIRLMKGWMAFPISLQTGISSSTDFTAESTQKSMRQ